jgi:putative membrane protein
MEVRMSWKLLLAAAVVMVGIENGVFAKAKADDMEFIADAIKGDNSEIALGRLATEKAASDGVRQFGQTLVTDHGKGKKEATDVASKLGVSPTDEMMPEAQEEMTKLKNLSGANFDKEFSSYMVKDHEEDLAKFHKEAEQGSGDVAEFARKTIPTLQKHLDMAQALSKSIN